MIEPTLKDLQFHHLLHLPYIFLLFLIFVWKIIFKKIFPFKSKLNYSNFLNFFDFTPLNFYIMARNNSEHLRLKYQLLRHIKLVTISHLVTLFLSTSWMFEFMINLLIQYIGNWKYLYKCYRFAWSILKCSIWSNLLYTI